MVVLLMAANVVNYYYLPLWRKMLLSCINESHLMNCTPYQVLTPACILKMHQSP